LKVISCLLRLQAELNAAPKNWRFEIGRKKIKPQYMMDGYCMLYAYYFANELTYTPNDFRQRFRINKELLMKIVYGVREYDD
jgi:hypothetical protein